MESICFLKWFDMRGVYYLGHSNLRQIVMQYSTMQLYSSLRCNLVDLARI